MFDDWDCVQLGVSGSWGLGEFMTVRGCVLLELQDVRGLAIPDDVHLRTDEHFLDNMQPATSFHSWALFRYWRLSIQDQTQGYLSVLHGVTLDISQ